nr:MAG TPA: hypothetical protein [Caudoviricetes sp.]
MKFSRFKFSKGKLGDFEEVCNIFPVEKYRKLDFKRVKRV